MLCGLATNHIDRPLIRTQPSHSPGLKRPQLGHNVHNLPAKPLDMNRFPIKVYTGRDSQVIAGYPWITDVIVAQSNWTEYFGKEHHLKVGLGSKKET